MAGENPYHLFEITADTEPPEGFDESVRRAALYARPIFFMTVMDIDGRQTGYEIHNSWFDGSVEYRPIMPTTES